PAETTPIVVLQGRGDIDWNDDEDEDDDAAPAAEPVIVAETLGELRKLTPGMAVLELEAAETAFMIFRNAAHGGLNVVYRRPDGHVGWIDPARASAQA